jgi:hypothetical protein
VNSIESSQRRAGRCSLLSASRDIWSPETLFSRAIPDGCGAGGKYFSVMAPARELDVTKLDFQKFYSRVGRVRSDNSIVQLVLNPRHQLFDETVS